MGTQKTFGALFVSSVNLPNGAPELRERQQSGEERAGVQRIGIVEHRLYLFALRNPKSLIAALFRSWSVYEHHKLEFFRVWCFLGIAGF